MLAEEVVVNMSSMGGKNGWKSMLQDKVGWKGRRNHYVQGNAPERV